MIKIKELREKKGLTQGKLAELLGLSRSTIAMYETNNSNPDYETLKKLSALFGVSIDYLLGNTELVPMEKPLVPETVTPERAKEIWLGTQSTATQMLINLVLRLDDFQKVRVSTFATTLLTEGAAA